MNNLSTTELKEIRANGFGLGLIIGGAIVFLIGLIDGYVNPLKCRS